MKENNTYNYWRYAQEGCNNECRFCGVKDKCTVFSILRTGIGRSALIKDIQYPSFGNDTACCECIRQNGVFDIDCINCRLNRERNNLINRNFAYLAKEKSSLDSWIIELFSTARIGEYKGQYYLVLNLTDDEELERIYGVYAINLGVLAYSLYKKEKNKNINIYTQKNIFSVFDQSQIKEFNFSKSYTEKNFLNFGIYDRQVCFYLPIKDKEGIQLIIMSLFDFNIIVVPKKDAEDVSQFLSVFNPTQNMKNFFDADTDEFIEDELLSVMHEKKSQYKNVATNLKFSHCVNIYMLLNADDQKNIFLRNEQTGDIYTLYNENDNTVINVETLKKIKEIDKSNFIWSLVRKN